ncbi:MAG: transcription-repair coupling factor [Candidatus Paracaedimonas acanthamoebae]|uniref:Transcription-repair-coupling factor n=1 Tax=Candidatus Paracaedimonas acanthamoebae TaxID=244581 RepID=A0A8J7TV18_9PROT|nr:transcription-repair coupling factor [Candidatus Paracaedimonas acanthamoebae]
MQILNIDHLLRNSTHITLGGVPEGAESFLLKEMLAQEPNTPLLYICHHETSLHELDATLRFLCPEVDILIFPPWDCLPYDRMSPKRDIIGERVTTLLKLNRALDKPTLVITTIQAFLQRVAPQEIFKDADLQLKIGTSFNLKTFENYCHKYGFMRVSTVREPSEYAIRGGIIDLFPSSSEQPYRLDLFGDEIDSIKIFDPLSQRSLENIQEINLSPCSEVLLDEKSIEVFRTSYRKAFGHTGEKDPLYQAISAGQSYAGMEHWLPLFYSQLATLLDYVPEATLVFDAKALDTAKAQLELIEENYQARKEFVTIKADNKAPYYPLSTELLYLSLEEIEKTIETKKVVHFSPFLKEGSPQIEGRKVPDFSAVRAQPNVNLLEALKERGENYIKSHKKVLLGCMTSGSRLRLQGLLQDHGCQANLVETWDDFITLPASIIGISLIPLEQGIEFKDFVLITEQDIFGERQSQPVKRKRRSDLFIGEAAALNEGDYVVHQEHGIGRFQGLKTLQVDQLPHDCVSLIYEGGDKLFVPVENLEILSRYGGEDSIVTLDKLGSSAWQHRKARVKNRLEDIAEHLIALAAERALRVGEIFQPSEGLYNEFSARFPYNETEDQERAISEVLQDLESGKPMDRLICGDVGFGKTEIALRAAFVVASSGKQVAIIAPTTLLCRQHYQNFQKRFEGFGLKVAQLSRLVPTKEAAGIKEGLEKGHVDVVVGTHAIFAQSTHFKNLGLVIVDEEQHFGVKQKEKLKDLQKDVHVLTLTATPIPRTLQMSLSGVRDMSIIATPPVDRLAVRTFVMPFDEIVMREALTREFNRGGQVFYVCPRIEDLESIQEKLRALMPEAKVAVAHGQLAPTILEKIMNDFYDRHYSILLSTNIIESGLDIPAVNTIIIHRSDLFGLAQLYQLRGRVGRSKTRGYAYLTIPDVITSTAQKRLEVMQTLDTLGAGFQLASHDMDIRGAGNLLGQQQSGHIREVGVELYQQMLQDAVDTVRHKSSETVPQTAAVWTPQIHLGLPILIPEDYVVDLATRLNLYRRLSHLENEDEIEAFTLELLDRFGALPQEVKNLLNVLRLKQLCRHVGVEKIETGEKGAIFTFYNNTFSNPVALIQFIHTQGGTVKLRPDHKLVFLRAWKEAQERVKGCEDILKELIKMV